MFRILIFSILILTAYILQAQSNKDFSDYWYAGQAEISSYELRQARYGELRQGTAVMVFVTEDFSEKTLTKMNNPVDDPKNKVPVLKLNMTKNFITGIYPYSLMMSVFTPANLNSWDHTLRVTATTQDWCGHTFTSYDWSKRKYHIWGHSYFDGEGDFDLKQNKVFLEDEIWTTLRIDPSKIPTGNFEMLPSAWIVRLLHLPAETVMASAEISNDPDDSRMRMYKLEIPQQERSLEIHFQKFFPYEIEFWEESYVSGSGDKKERLTTTAVKKATIMSDYWNHNSIADSTLRNELKLEE
jgi:hypothetical protein